MEDREILLLLATEVERHLKRLELPRSWADLRVNLHTLKGSAGLARQHDLALVVAQLSSRAKAEDVEAAADLKALLEGILPRLREGKPALSGQWPEPPFGLRSSRIDPGFERDYLSAMRDRLLELDAAMEREEAGQVLDQAYRSAHAMKSIAGSAGDAPTGWYCHGLETFLKNLPRGEGDASRVRSELARHRAIIAELLEQPERALQSLRSFTRGADAPVKRPNPSRAPFEAAHTSSAHADVALRVSPDFFARLVERVERVDLARDEFLRFSQNNRLAAGRLRDLRAQLQEASRRIGPPRPWGPPSAAVEALTGVADALATLADANDRLALASRGSAEALRAAGTALRDDLSTQRSTTIQWVFDRVIHGIENLVAEDQKVEVAASGPGMEIDRRLAEALLDPLLQLARNAVAHGIERTSDRAMAGKPEAGTIRLQGERIGDWLRVCMDDDGRGVDTERIHSLAQAQGLLSEEALRRATETDLLNLLFLPGFTTQEAPDLLAGRGVGLDLAQSKVRRLGGAIRLESRRGSGLRAIVEVPAERASVNVLWIMLGDAEFALPVSYAGRVGLAETLPPRVSLARCLSIPEVSPSRYAVEVAILGVQSVVLGVDAVGNVEEALVRSVPRLVMGRGPYAGAILRGDGSLRLVLDGSLLAARAWASVS